MSRPALVVGAEAATPLYTLGSITQLQHQPSDPRTARIRVLGSGDYQYDAASTASPDGLTVIAPTGQEGGSGRWLRVDAQATSERVSVKEYGVKADGLTDDSANLRAAIAGVAGTGKRLFFPKGTYLVSRDGSNAWGLKVPSNTTLEFERGAVLKLKANSPAWTRLLAIQNASHVSLLGHLELDGQGTTHASGNEHMHGLFIYDSSDVLVESIDSHDCRGDNVSISGTGEAGGSQRVTIDRITARKAGRKNLVIEAVNDLHVRTAFLDNAEGGFPGWAGENSVDFEPFGITPSGAQPFTARFDYLATTGRGNDFTIGTTDALSDRYRLTIGTFVVNAVGTPSTQPVLLSYAANVKVDNLIVRATGSTVPQHLLYTQYAARWEVKNALLELEGASPNAVVKVTGQAGDQKGRVSFGKLRVKAPQAGGVEVWGADFHADLLETECGAGRALHAFSTRSDSSVTIGTLHATNSGAPGWEVVRATSYGGQAQHLRIGHLICRDTRASKASEALHVGAGMNDRTVVTSIEATDLPREVGYDPGATDTYYRLAGGHASVGVFSVAGTPEGVISAPVGSLALRSDGKTAATLYRKESGGGTTGWVASGLKSENDGLLTGIEGGQVTPSDGTSLILAASEDCYLPDGGATVGTPPSGDLTVSLKRGSATLATLTVPAGGTSGTPALLPAFVGQGSAVSVVTSGSAGAGNLAYYFTRRKCNVPLKNVIALYDFTQGADATVLYERTGSGLNGTLGAGSLAPEWLAGGGLSFAGAQVAALSGVNVTTGGYSVVYGVKRGANGGSVVLLGSGAGNPTYDGEGYSGSQQAFAGGSYAGGQASIYAPLADVMSVVSVRAPGDFRLFANGVKVSASVTGAPAATSFAFLGAGDASAAYGWRGGLHFLAVIAGGLSDAEAVRACGWVNEFMASRGVV